ncbi:MAG: class I SAM-dependent methyltransferase [Verrucomicrobia bacterium]|nr:class I SAM-dependent methyltransferase [Verrucomicrobiota bacterium]MCH8512707.1 class I SAM-dependent methyltransferase [Kiritimatiellia bacterium]
MPEPVIVNAVLKRIKALPGWPKLRVLDLSCGDGEVIDELCREGCQAEGTHFRADDYIYNSPSEALDTSTIHERIDLTRPLPFGDGEYDVVLATEVLEHLPSHILLSAEIGRILKPGGHFVFSTPNVHRLQSRLRFFLSGQHELRGARLDWSVGADDLYSTHYNRIYFPVMHSVLYHNGLRVEAMGFTEAKWSAFLMGLFLPLVIPVTALELRHAHKRSPECGKDLLRWMLHPCMLFSDQMLVVSRKHQ